MNLDRRALLAGGASMLALGTTQSAQAQSKSKLRFSAAFPETDLRAEAKASGFDAYVTKPIDVPWLNELIKGLLV